MSGYKLDFAAIKREHPIEKVAERLGIALKPHGHQLRGKCFSGQGDERALIVTPAKGVWYSHVLKAGGDVLELVAAVKDVPVRDAAAWIAGAPKEPEKSANGRATNAEFKPVELTHDHPSVLVHFEAADATRFGIGFKEKAAGAGNILIPVYDQETKKLAGYVGVQDITWLPEKWRA